MVHAPQYSIVLSLNYSEASIPINTGFPIPITFDCTSNIMLPPFNLIVSCSDFSAKKRKRVFIQKCFPQRNITKFPITEVLEITRSFGRYKLLAFSSGNYAKYILSYL